MRQVHEELLMRNPVDVDDNWLQDLHSMSVSRRRLVARLTAAGLSTSAIAALLSSDVFAQDVTPVPTPEVTPSPDEILRGIGKDTRLISYGSTVFGTPLELVDGLTVPNELFFIRSNGPVSFDIAPAEWRLAVTGLVNSPLDLSLDDLQGLPQRTVTAFLECSGDSRSRFVPEAEGTPWGNTAIGNAEWIGTPLAAVLDLASVQDGAVDVVSQGGDFPEMQRGLPLDKALDPDTLLVWSMNGEPLPAPHGGPVRLLVPGWGGIASTKWLVGLEVIDHPFAGHYNAESYVLIDEQEHVLEPVTTMPVKSVIAEPLPNATLPAGQHTIAGYAWSGYGGITKVEVSTDGGATWNEAPITLQAGRLSWVRFDYPWTSIAGPALLRSRAYDERGLTQPDTVPWNAKGYLMNAVFAVPVFVT
jgi:DMSO/TMAO reductase YedYZ molybdopterin-dependent catalytic subunit